MIENVLYRGTIFCCASLSFIKVCATDIQPILSVCMIRTPNSMCEASVVASYGERGSAHLRTGDWIDNFNFHKNSSDVHWNLLSFNVIFGIGADTDEKSFPNFL